MKRKGKKPFPSRNQIDACRLLAKWYKHTNAAEAEVKFSDKSDRVISSVAAWNGNIIRWQKNHFFYLPYKSFKAMPYKMTLAMYKSHKQNIA